MLLSYQIPRVGNSQTVDPKRNEQTHIQKNSNLGLKYTITNSEETFSYENYSKSYNCENILLCHL